MTDNEIIKALDRLKATKDYLREQYQERVKNCLYPELKPIAKQTYEDNKKAFNIAIKAIEEFNRQKAEIEQLKKEIENLESMQEISPEAKYLVDTKADKVISLLNEVIKSQEQIKAEAYKECIEKIEERLAVHSFTSNSTEYTDGFLDCIEWVDSKLDELKKEMVGEDNA